MEKRNNKSASLSTSQPAFMPTHPGEILKLELEERGLTQKAFAEQIDMRASHLNELLRGKRSMTIAIADKLQEALGIDSQSWMNMQTQYNYDVKAAKPRQEKKTVTLEVDVEDTSLLSEIKRAIGLLRGVGRVAVL